MVSPSRADVSRSAARTAMALILAVGAALRFWGLGSQSLWVDELLTLKAADIGGHLAVPDVFWNIQGPLHAGVVHLVASFSQSEAALRAPSAVAGLAAIPVVYVLGRELADRLTGLAAASLIAVSPFAVWYSQEVRNYSFLILFASLATLAVWRLVAGRGRGLVLYVASAVLALYSNLSAAFLILAHNVFALVRLARRGLLRKWLLALAAVFVLFVPLLLGLGRWVASDEVVERVVVAPLAEDDELLRGGTTFSPLAVPYAAFSMVYGYSLGPSMRELHTSSPAAAFVRRAWVVLPAGLVALAGLAVGVRELWRRGAAGRMVLSILIVPVASAAALALLNVKPFNVRYVAVALPALVVALAAGVTALGRRRGAVLWGALVLLSCVSLGHYYLDPTYAKEDVRAAARHVAAREREGDIVLVPVVRDVFTFYFDGDADQFVLYRGQTASSEKLAARITEAVSGRHRLWFVESRLWHIDPDGRVPRFLDERYGLEERTEYPGVTVSLYALDAAGTPAGS